MRHHRAGTDRLFAVQVARLVGCDLYLVGTVGDVGRLKVGESLGATRILVGEDDAAARVSEMSGGYGAPLRLTPQATRQPSGSMELVARNGQITKIGWGPSQEFSLIPSSEKGGSAQDVQPPGERGGGAFLIASGGIQMEPMVTTSFPSRNGELPTI